MKKNNAKSFTFHLAKENDKSNQWKASNTAAVAGIDGNLGRDGTGGCTLVEQGWFGPSKEPMTTPGIGGDGPMYC